MRYRFGEFLFDPAARSLSRDAAGLALTPKAARLLGLLLERAPEAISREALYEQLWPGTFVEPGNLHNLISELRRVLADDDHDLIRTARGAGYAIAAVVQAEPTARYRLVIGDDAIELPDGATIVGRDDTRTPDVSRRHARILVDRDNITVEDLGSKNGTFVRAVKLQHPLRIEDGDEIVLGRTRARIERLQATTLTVAPLTGNRGSGRGR